MTTTPENKAAPLYGLVLAGGASRRMGKDKGSVEYRGTPQARRAFALVAEHCERAMVSLRSEQSGLDSYAGLPLLTDKIESTGPVAGIWSAMQEAPSAAWLVISCDLPLLDGGGVEALIAGRDSSCEATCFRAADGRPEPLCAIYEPGFREALAKAIEQGERSVRAILDGVEVALIEPPRPETVCGANTPGERARAEAALAERSTPECA